ncbi:MAG: glutamate synthase central domain-containing protein [Lachnospiraceae bacterium]
MLKIKNMKVEGFHVRGPDHFYKSIGLEKAIDHPCLEVDRAYRDGANILILTDRGVDEIRMPIPSLLAVSAVHQYLVRTKRRTSLALILGVRRTA